MGNPRTTTLLNLVSHEGRKPFIDQLLGEIFVTLYAISDRAGRLEIDYSTLLERLIRS